MILKLTTVAALASLSAVGAFAVVAQAASAPTLRPTLKQPVVRAAASPLVPQFQQATTADGRAVRVVYPSPFAQK